MRVNKNRCLKLACFAKKFFDEILKSSRREENKRFYVLTRALKSNLNKLIATTKKRKPLMIKVFNPRVRSSVA